MRGGEGGPYAAGHAPALIVPLPLPLPASSADTTAERDYWQSFVWPGLKSVCDGLELAWEVADLR